MVDLMYEVSKIAQWMIFEKKHEKTKKKLIMVCFDVPKRRRNLQKMNFSPEFIVIYLALK